ncbi:MAG: PLP-dependent aminotransferase family protein [Thermaerobacter sp.]|nr:PLP-dependent aminotransferase family protein [Thermaerobacter sp.]
MTHIPETSLSDTLYRQLKEAILEGRLRPGERLPSSRMLAHEKGISRNTVLAAWERLAAEGYLVSSPGSATRVRPDLATHSADGQDSDVSLSLTPWAEHLRNLPPPVFRPVLPYDFRSTQPAVDEFPFQQWRRLQAALWQRIGPDDLDYQEPGGRAELRAALAAHLAVHRGISCDPDQIVIVSGAQQALDLLARLLVRQGDPVALEQPSYPGARIAFAAAGGRIVPIPVDNEGLRVDLLPAQWRIACVTPSHQYPTGAILSLQRRLALIERAAKAGGLIVEDDYNAEFRYQCRPVPALQSLDRQGRVVYVGTFSKSLFPALRLGFVVAPKALVEPSCAPSGSPTATSPWSRSSFWRDFSQRATSTATSTACADGMRRRRRCFSRRWLRHRLRSPCPKPGRGCTSSAPSRKTSIRTRSWQMPWRAGSVSAGRRAMRPQVSSWDSRAFRSGKFVKAAAELRQPFGTSEAGTEYH